MGIWGTIKSKVSSIFKPRAPVTGVIKPQPSVSSASGGGITLSPTRTISSSTGSGGGSSQRWREVTRPGGEYWDPGAGGGMTYGHGLAPSGAIYLRPSGRRASEPSPTPTPPPIPTEVGKISDEGFIVKGVSPTETARKIQEAGGLPSREFRRRLQPFEYKGRRVSGAEVLRAEARARRERRIVSSPTQEIQPRSFEMTGEITEPSGGVGPSGDLEPKPPKGFWGKTIDVLFGEKGKKYVGLNLRPKLFPGFQKVDVPAQDVVDILKQTPTDIGLRGKTPLAFGGIDSSLPDPLKYTGFGVRVGAELLPTTPGEVAIDVGTVGTFPLAPKIIRTGISGGVGVLGIKGVITPSKTPEQRVASGLIGVAGVGGFVGEGLPFIRGATARVSPKFRKVKVQEEGFKAIETPEGRIGLIEPGAPLRTGVTTDVKLPKTSPLKRGGFGIKPSEKKLFLGTQDVATSQIGLFKKGKRIEFERELFVTPGEPTLKIPETRVSRLGLEDPLKFPKDAEISWGIPGKPQIGIERGARVGWTERGGAWRIGTGTELEAIKGLGVIDVKRKIGVTTIKGQRVDIFEIKTSLGRKGVKVVQAPSVSTGGLSRVSGEGLISTLGTSKITRTTTPLILTRKGIGTTSKGKKTTPITTPTGRVTIPTISPPKTPKISPPISPPKRTPTKISPPKTPPFSPPIIPPFIPPRQPPRRPRRAPSYGRRNPFAPTRVRKTRRVPRIPSLLALGRGIIAPTRGRGEFTGLTIRPIIKKKKKKKVKGGKKK